MLSETNNLKLLQKARDEFNDFEQNLFFFFNAIFQKFDEQNDYIIDFDIAWKICGYTRKDSAKKILLKRLRENVDYTISKISPNSSEDLSPPNGGAAPIGMAGQNKETIMLTPDAFKFFCLSSNTEQGRKTQEFFVKLQRVVNIYIRDQAIQNAKALEDALALENARSKDVESDLIKLNSGKPVVYLALVEDNLVKFGCTHDISQRAKQNSRDFPKFVIQHVIPTEYYKDLETMIKNSLGSHIISKEFNGKTQTELIELSEEMHDEETITLPEVYDHVLKLRQELEEKKKCDPWEEVPALYRELTRNRKRIREFSKGWKLAEKYISRERCGDEYEKIRECFEGKVGNEQKLKSLMQFSKRLYEENDETEVWYRNSDLYDDYKTYVEHKKSHLHVYSPKTFSNKFCEIFRDSVQAKNKNILRAEDEPNGSKKSTHGKLVKFDAMFCRSILRHEYASVSN